MVWLCCADPAGSEFPIEDPRSFQTFFISRGEFCLRAAAPDGQPTGDGANDIPMIEAADYGIAYRAKPKAREAANGRIASVKLTAILKLLGIAESEWVEDFDPA